jgi:hypothetical protein
MDLVAFAVTLLVVALPVAGLFALAAWLADRQIGRVRLVDRQGRTLAEVVLDGGPGGHEPPNTPA